MGRPSKYRETYCNEVIQHMADGASLTSFAAEIGVARSTINEWMDEHPEFSEACARAKAKCAAWWERAGRQIILAGGNGAQASLVTFGMKNMGRDDWQEKHLVGSDPENPLPAAQVIDASQLSTEVLRAIAAAKGE
jgi:hypothetical protein